MRQRTHSMVPLIAGDAARHALRAATARWRETPHVAGQATPGRNGGVDCIHFVAAVFDEIYTALAPGVTDERFEIGRPAQDLGVHDAGAGARLASWMRRRWPMRRVFVHATRLRSDEDLVRTALRMRPGDAVVMRIGGGANHVGVCGMEPWSVWHAAGDGVSMATLGDASLVRSIDRVYRPCVAVVPAAQEERA